MANTPKAQWRMLRRYVLSGEKEAARSLLQDMLRSNPEDAEAAAELRRLEQGHPLLCTETQKQRKERQLQEALHALARDVEAHNPKILAAKHTEELLKLRADLKEYLHTISGSKSPAPPGTNAYKKALEHELSRRHKKSVKSRTSIALFLLFVLLGLGGTIWALHNRAVSIAEQLESAWIAQEWEKTEALLKATDSGINRLMYPQSGALIAKVRNWQQGCIGRANDLSHQMQLYKKRDAISSLSLEERAVFLRRIRALPLYHSQELLARWEELCRPEKEKLDMQRDAIVAEIEAAATAPPLTGDWTQDANLLKKAAANLQRLIATFDSAKDAFDLPAELISPDQNLLLQLQTYLADIEIQKKADMQLRTARTYEQHFKALSGLTPVQYPPALQMAEAGRSLPTAEDICNEVRAYRFKIPRVIPPEVIQAIVHKGPSFCASYPASLQQLHLMEDIFTGRTLRQKVYEVFRASGEVHYTDAPPTVTEKNSATFTMSELDPARKVSRSPRIEWENAHAVWSRTLDATPILKVTGITRERFFLTANLPDVLARVTTIRDKDCPALAKAYVYHTLLEVMRLHSKKPDILGLRYSPTLQEDIKSFRLVSSRCKLPLSVTCWLSRSAEAMEAESLFARWFDTHADRDYSAEMSRQLSRILRTRPRYIGYVDAAGQPRFREQPAEGSTIWYLSGDKMLPQPYGKPLQAPAPYSPLFTE